MYIYIYICIHTPCIYGHGQYVYMDMDSMYIWIGVVLILARDKHTHHYIPYYFLWTIPTSRKVHPLPIGSNRSLWRIQVSFIGLFCKRDL